MKENILILTIVLLSSFSSFAQLKFGTDIYSRYLWRGLDFGDAPAFQPSLSYTVGGLTVGAWASYAFPTSGTTYSENDLYASYTFSTENAGSFSAVFTDYYLPSIGIPFGYYKPTDIHPVAAHTLEGGLSYSGAAKFPISLSLYSNLSNDPDNSVYIQASYPFTIDDATLTLTTGFVPSKSAYYATADGGIINLSVTATKSISITDKFALPINVSYVANPATDKTYLVFGVSFIF